MGWGCTICKVIVGLVLLIILGALIYALLSGGALPAILSQFGISVKAGADGFGAWTAFINWLAGKFGIEGAAATKLLGYEVFSGIIAAGAGAMYLLADIVSWLLCLVCKLIGQCDDCKRPF